MSDSVHATMQQVRTDFCDEPKGAGKALLRPGTPSCVVDQATGALRCLNQDYPNCHGRTRHMMDKMTQ